MKTSATSLSSGTHRTGGLTNGFRRQAYLFIGFAQRGLDGRVVVFFRGSAGKADLPRVVRQMIGTPRENQFRLRKVKKGDQHGCCLTGPVVTLALRPETTNVQLPDARLERRDRFE